MAKIVPLLGLTLGGVGLALALQARRGSQTTTEPPPPVPGKSIKDMTTAQKSKLEEWAKKKGVPIDQAYDLAKQVYQMKF